MGMIILFNKDKKIDIIYFGIDKIGFMKLVIIEGIELEKIKEVVVDIFLKEFGYKLGSKFKDSVIGEEFMIIVFIKNNIFSYLLVIFVGWDVWKLVY